MPAKTPKQQRFMGMCAHTEKPPKRCPPKPVAREMARLPTGQAGKPVRKK